MVGSTVTCNTCSPGYYLSSGTCTAVPSANTNCVNGTVTNSTFTCNACASGYYLNS
jgi:hypothetical protein